MSASTTYSLKTIIIARALAEISVLAILCALPLVLFCIGKFNVLHVILRAGICLVSPVALLGLWGFAQITYKVIADDSGIITRSLLQKRFLSWKEIIGLKQTNKWGLREYSLIHKDGEISFPAMLNRSSVLVGLIRDRLPDRGRSTTGDAQLFKVAPICLILEAGKMILQIGFAVLFFSFFDSLKKGGKTSTEDTIFVLALAIIISAILLWKVSQFARLPKEVLVEKTGLTLKGLFNSVKIDWNEIKSLAAANLFFPEGMFVRTDKKSYLIGNSINGSDELFEEIQQRFARTKQIDV